MTLRHVDLLSDCLCEQGLKKLDLALTKSVYSLLFVFLFAEQTVVEVEDDRTLALHCSSEEKTELGSASWA